MRCFVDPPAIFLYKEFVDFRKSINGLVVVVEQELESSAFEPALYVFCNRARDKLKILYWDNTGFALWYKRLEKARFKWPTQIQAATLTLSEQQLQWLLDGYDVIGHQPVFFQRAS
jgi:transposase